MYYDISNLDNKILIYKIGKGKIKKIFFLIKKFVKEGKVKGKVKGKGKKKEESSEFKFVESELVFQELVKESILLFFIFLLQEELFVFDLESDRVRIRYSVVS